eukprot:1218789-Rhodomonas_salina.1
MGWGRGAAPGVDWGGREGASRASESERRGGVMVSRSKRERRLARLAGAGAELMQPTGHRGVDTGA